MMKRFVPSPEHRPLSSRPTGRALRIRWLGTAGHVLETGGLTLLVDPFLTRPSLLRTAALPLHPTPDDWWHWLPERLDAIVVGHSHYDHLMDAPEIARRTGALIVGSRSTERFARAAGVPSEQIRTVPEGGGAIDLGPVRVRLIPSLHGRIAAGRVPFDGEAPARPRLPARLWHYRMGGAFGVLIEGPDGRVYHNGSADLIDAALEGLGAEVVLVGLAGRQATPRYLERLVGSLGPSLVVPTHHDFFFRPLEDGPRLLPGIDLGGFVSDLRRIHRQARIVMPTYEDVLHVPADGDASEAVVTPL